MELMPPLRSPSGKQQGYLTTKSPNDECKVSARKSLILQQEDCEYKITSQLP